MIDIIIGCPTRNRTWILPTWKQYVEEAVPDDWYCSYVFVVGEDDEETIEMLSSWNSTKIIKVTEPEIPEERSWGDKERFRHMAFLRNTMLEYVRKQAPDLFLSLDSDILINPKTICNLYETVVQCNADAVGGLTYFDQMDQRTTNVASWNNKASKQGFKRIISDGVFPVDIIMGIKMMTDPAYNVDYQYHNNGEDLGWAIAASELNIYYDGRSASKHVMYKDWLDRKDKRVGY